MTTFADILADLNQYLAAIRTTGTTNGGWRDELMTLDTKASVQAMQLLASSSPLGVALNGYIGDLPAYTLMPFGQRTGSFAASPAYTDVAPFALAAVGANSVITRLTGTEELEIVSTSANDTANGTGVRTVGIVGLDALGNEQIYFAAMNGTTPVSLGATRWRGTINIVEAATLGTTDGTAVGTISIRRVSDGRIVAQIEANTNTSTGAWYTVPKGKTGYITQFYGSYIGANAGTVAGTYSLRINASRVTGERGNGVFISRLRTRIPAGGERNFQVAFIVPELCTVKASVVASGADSEVGVGFEIVVRDNEVA